MRRIVAGIASLHGIKSEVTYTREFVPLINDAALANEVLNAADPVSVKAIKATAPMTGSEDFARFLAHVPGCFSFVGNGEASAPLHNASYDFNDATLIHGAEVHVAITRKRLNVPVSEKE